MRPEEPWRPPELRRPPLERWLRVVFQLGPMGGTEQIMRTWPERIVLPGVEAWGTAQTVYVRTDEEMRGARVYRYQP